MNRPLSPVSDQPHELYRQSIQLMSGEVLALSELSSNILLIVNTASRCGFTPQYRELESLYQTYHERGLIIIGCPCDQFGGQELDSNAEVQEFCQLNFKTTFPLAQKLKVNGVETHPLFRTLKSSAKGLLGTERVKWNFTKFLVAPQGAWFKRYAPQTTPISLKNEIERLLKESEANPLG